MTDRDGVTLIAAERRRQIEIEGWTPAHDDEHTAGELALVACCYATPVPLYRAGKFTEGFSDPWPSSWHVRWDKRFRAAGYRTTKDAVPHPAEYGDSARIDLLAKAGALIAAEIDRLQRANL